MKKKRRFFHGRIGITLLWSAIIFFTLLLAMVAVNLLILVLSRNHLSGELKFISPQIIILCALCGFLLAAFTSIILLRPINRTIDKMNQLASGDFKTRLSFGKPIARHPTFIELANSFNTMAQALENTDILYSDFINSFSHEFKTPIVSIAGFAKLLRRGCLPKEQEQEYLAIIEEEALRLADMATNALNLSKVENQTILTNVTRFNLSEQLRSCVLLLENKWSQKDLQLELDFPEYFICANEELLRQLWLNLLDNAIKFTPPTGEISLRLSQTGQETKVQVVNFGSEIPPDKLEKIFQKFYQVDESHATAGHGIGLAVAQRVVRLHQGDIYAESEGGMTTFTVTLPSHLPVTAR